MYQDLVNMKIPANFNGKNKIKVQLWFLCKAIFFRCSPVFMYRFRCFILRLFGAKIGINVKIRPSVDVFYPWNLSIGDNSYIAENVIIYNLDYISIGNNVSISMCTVLCTGSHDYISKTFDLLLSPIEIADEVWIAADCFVMPGVKIGMYSVLGARSFLKCQINENEIWAGHPAKFIKNRVCNDVKK